MYTESLQVGVINTDLNMRVLNNDNPVNFAGNFIYTMQI